MQDEDTNIAPKKDVKEPEPTINEAEELAKKMKKQEEEELKLSFKGNPSKFFKIELDDLGDPQLNSE